MPTRLGQNFLRDEDVIEKIADVAGLKSEDIVVEIGPGKGILTEALAKKCKKVVAIEIDKDLAGQLRKNFRNKKNVEIINADILKINLSELLGSEASKYKVVANLPYYITSPIIRLFLESKFPPFEMILMVQKEVAERIISGPGKMSILALSVQYYAKVELLFEVNKSCFFPAPKVDSAVIRITRSLKHETISRSETDNFFRVVRAGFSAKRKLLVNNLANSFHLDKKDTEDKIKKARVSPSSRAQELSVSEWEKLAKIFSK